MFDNVFHRSLPAICQLIYEDQHGNKVASGTGFIFRKRLVTCYHVATAAFPGGKIRIMFGAWDAREHVFTVEEFAALLIGFSPRDKRDLAIYEASFFPRHEECSLDVPHVLPQLRPFQPVAIIGHPFGVSEAVGHRSVITRTFESDGVQLMQLEGAINVGNSGGPVLTLEEGGVIGVVVRKQPGLSDAFEVMRNRLVDQMRSLEAKEMTGDNLVLKQSILETQNAVRILSDEVLRSTNTGIGYAVLVQEVLRTLKDYE
jgi:hypothetical protein